MYIYAAGNPYTLVVTKNQRLHKAKVYRNNKARLVLLDRVHPLLKANGETIQMLKSR